MARGRWVLTCTATNYEDWVKKHDHIYDITLSENIESAHLHVCSICSYVNM